MGCRKVVEETRFMPSRVATFRSGLRLSSIVTDMVLPSSTLQSTHQLLLSKQ